MADTPTSPCMVAHHETEKNRFYYVNYGAILFNKIALSENVQMGISTDNLGMGLSAILKGVYQVRAIGSGTTPLPSVFTHTVPSSMTIGQSYQISFSGVTSTQGSVTYTLATVQLNENVPTALGSMASFSKRDGILAGENITIDVHADSGNGAHDVAVPGNYSFEVRAYAGQTLVSSHTINFALTAASVAVNVSEVFNSQIIPGGSTPGAGNQAVTNVNLKDYGGAVHIKSLDFNYKHALFGLPLSDRANGRTCINTADTLPSNAYLANMLDVINETTWVTTGGNNQLNQPASRYLATTFRDSPRFYKYLNWNGTGGGESTQVPFSADGSFDMGAEIGMIVGTPTQTGTNRVVWHRSMPNSRALLNDPYGSGSFLTSEGLPNSGEQYWGNQTPTSRALFVGQSFNDANAKYLFHVFAHDPSPDGIIYCGEFTHDNLSSATMVDIGWKPQRLSLLPVDGYAVYADGVATYQKNLSYIYDKQIGWKGPYPLDKTAKTLMYNLNQAATIYTHSTIAVENTGFKVQDLPSGRYVFMAIRDDGSAVSPPLLTGVISHNIPSSVTAGSNYSVTFGGKSATSGTVLYSVNVNSGSQYVTFTKTSGIAAGETVYLSVASNAPNGYSVSGTITANTSPVGASNGPDAAGFSLGTLALVEPDPSFSGFSHTVPANTQQGQSYTVTFSGTSSSNGHQVWYSLSPQSGLSFSKLDNISPGEAVTMTVSGSASGTLGVSVYANTTKNNGSTVTQSVSYIQTTVAVPVTFDSSHLKVTLGLVSKGPNGGHDGATFSVNVSGAAFSDNRPISFRITDGNSFNPVSAGIVPQGTTTTFKAVRNAASAQQWPGYTIVFSDSAGNVCGWEGLQEQLNIYGPFDNIPLNSLPITVSH